MSRRQRSLIVMFVAAIAASGPAGRMSSLAAAAVDAKQIVEEAQKRTNTKSQRYEGVLQVFDAKGKISDKRWILERLGSYGNSKVTIRFTVPAPSGL